MEEMKEIRRTLRNLALTSRTRDLTANKTQIPGRSEYQFVLEVKNVSNEEVDEMIRQLTTHGNLQEAAYNGDTLSLTMRGIRRPDRPSRLFQNVVEHTVKSLAPEAEVRLISITGGG